MTAVEWLHQFDPDAPRQDIHGLLGQMLFSGEEGLKPTEALSGGETARLLFCRLMLQKPNVLVLDEPTNHLDLESINALNIALQKYEGTVFLVTHDEDLMDEVGTRVWHLEPGKLTTSRARTRSTSDHAAERLGACATQARCVSRRRALRPGQHGSHARRIAYRLSPSIECVHDFERNPANVPRVLSEERAPSRPQLAARPRRRPDAALHQRRDEPVQGRVPRPREARLHARDDARRR